MTKLKSECPRPEEGSALLVVLLAASLLAGLGLALAGLGSVETAIASNHRAASQLAYAAESSAEVALAELLTVSDWTDVLSGVASSRFAGHAVPPVGPAEPPMTLAQLTAAMQTEYARLGSWGADTPQWRMFGHGWLSELVPVAAPAASHDEFVAAFVADDVSEHDGNPMVDTNGRIQIAARACTTRGAHRTMFATVERISAASGGVPGVRVLSWKEIQ